MADFAGSSRQDPLGHWDSADGTTLTQNINSFGAPVELFDHISWVIPPDTAALTSDAGSPVVWPEGQPKEHVPFGRGASADGMYLDRIHVIVEGSEYGRPNRRNVGFLLSTISVDVEVWNSYRFSQTLSTVVPTGDGISVTDPYGAPTIFLPFQSRIYEVELTAEGSPQVENFVEFDFAGVDEPLAEFVEGLRVLPFPFEPGTTSGIAESFEYATDVMVAYDDSEQRFELRDPAFRRIRFEIRALEEEESALLYNLLWNWSRNVFGIPIWWDGSDLTSAIGPGATSVPCLTSGREFAVGDSAIIYRDPFTWEVFRVSTVGASALGVDGAIVQSHWATDIRGVRVFPLRIGYLPVTFQVESYRGDMSGFEADFEVVA